MILILYNNVKINNLGSSGTNKMKYKHIEKPTISIFYLLFYFYCLLIVLFKKLLNKITNEKFFLLKKLQLFV